MRRAILATVLIISGLATPARSALVITIGNRTIAEGDNGTVDVSIQGTGDLLDLFGFQFLITPSGPGGLNFQPIQSDAELTDPAYVFVGNSANASTSSPLGIVSGDTYTGGDGTTSTTGVPVTLSRLLARLDLTAAAGSAGQSFTISLVSPSGSTFFRDPDLNDIPFSSVSGTVVVTAAIPEASTLVSALFGSAALATVMYLRSRRARPRTA